MSAPFFRPIEKHVSVDGSGWEGSTMRRARQSRVAASAAADLNLVGSQMAQGSDRRSVESSRNHRMLRAAILAWSIPCVFFLPRPYQDGVALGVVALAISLVTTLCFRALAEGRTR